jgi:hypothetical protein
VKIFIRFVKKKKFPKLTFTFELPYSNENDEMIFFNTPHKNNLEMPETVLK